MPDCQRRMEVCNLQHIFWQYGVFAKTIASLDPMKPKRSPFVEDGRFNNFTIGKN
jgi:hypothetical protein